jgi:hypothetical protein
MRKFGVISALGAVMLVAAPAAADDLENLLGGWTLVSWTANDAEGNVLRYPMGEDALGAIIYSPDGRMSAHLARKPDMADAGAEDGEAPGLGDSLAYGGVLEVDEEAGVVHHHVDIASIPSWIGTTLTRTYELDGDTLTLTTQPNGAGGVNTLVWARVAAED